MCSWDMSKSIGTDRGNTSRVVRRKSQPMLHRLETLEQRKLLTTLVGGDTFQFIDVHGQVVRITVNGDAIVELIGAHTDGQNLFLGDLTGGFVSSEVGKEGSRVGPDGVELLTSLSIIDGVDPNFSIPWQGAGVNEINLQALASNSNGDLYAINVLEANVGGTLQKIVQLIEIDTVAGVGNVTFHLQNDLPADIEAIRAAAFDPNNPDMLYFVGETDGIDHLYTVNVQNGVVTEVGTFGEINDDVRDVKAITFDDLGGVSELIVLTEEEGANRIVVVNPTAPGTFLLEVEVDFAGGALTNLEGISLLQDIDGIADNVLVAVESAGAGSGLYLIDITTGEAVRVSSLPDLTDTTPPVRGQNLQDLTWLPNILNPFTGELGAFVAIDATSDELVFVDPFELEFHQLFAIYVSQASENASITVSTFHIDLDIAFETPFTGVSELNDDGTNTITESSDTRYDMVVLDPNGNPIIITQTDDVGGVHIGALQWLLRPGGTEPEPLLPLIEGVLAQQLGVYASGIDLTPESPFTNVSAGVFVAPSLLDYLIGGTTVAERMMGLNLDNIGGLAVKRDQSADDAIVVIDIDGVDDEGNEMNGGAGGDQLALLNPQTGLAITLVDVIDGNTANPLSNVQGIAFGDVNFTGNEVLYAIYNILGDVTLGTINTDPNSPTFGEFTAIGVLNLPVGVDGVRSMTFAPTEGSVPGQQGLYVIGTDGQLYEIDPTDGTVLTLGDQLVDSDGNPVEIGAIFFNRLGTRLLGHDTENGRLVDLDLTMVGTGQVVVGQQVATEAGSLRPTLGGIAYDYTNDRFLAVDNAPSMKDLADLEADALESAVLMKLRGIDNDVDTSQDIDYIMIGGRLTGKVDLSGSINTFYAGLILTGDAFGQPLGPSTRPGNFHVGGDLRNLVSGVSMGTFAQTNGIEPPYLTGFDLVVDGMLGQVWALHSIIGTIDVVNDLNVRGSDTEFRELEGRQIDPDPNIATWINWSDGLLFDEDGRFFNDTFATAQMLGTLRGQNGEAGRTTITGVLQGSANDPLDFYSIALMAGQTIEIVLDELLSSSLAVGVYDPDGRLIASNAHTTGFDVTFDPFRITADRPGEYRIVVSFDWTFEGNTLPFDMGYTIHINEVGDVALGGVRANGDYLSVATGQRGIHVQRGDLGALRAGGSFLFASGNAPHMTPSDIHVRDGNLRSIHVGGALANGSTPVIEVRSGGIGLVRADGDELYLITGDFLVNGDPGALVDGDIQVVMSPGNVGGSIFTNASLGMIRAGSMTFGGDTIYVNADHTGEDGIIDLIDVLGDLGVPGIGGPQITTGPGGNVRYMRVGGTIVQDTMFMGGNYEQITLAEGESYVHVDDGGGRVRITPGRIENPDFDPTLPEGPDNPRYLSGALTIHRYAIRGSGGSVLVSVTSSGFGIDFESLSNVGSTGPVEVSLVQVAGAGQEVVLDANGRPVLDTASGTPLSAVFRGALPIDVLEIVGGNFTEVVNSTGGELASLIAASVGVIRVKGTLGLPKNHTGAALVLADLIVDGFPFLAQTTAIAVQGHVERIQAGEALGNIVVLGSVGEILANNDKTNTTGKVEGILAPIAVGGDLFRVNIGESLAPSGSGAMSHGGIYVIGRIGEVVNQGLGSDIRGDIVSQTGIDSIKLNHGAIINAFIGVVTDLQSVSVPSTIGQNYVNGQSIGTISLTGQGGIIGSSIAAYDIGNITVKNGFGIIHSSIFTDGQGGIGNITVDGYGVLGVNIQAANSMGNLTITGDGRVLAMTNYTESVRYSDYGLRYDPRFNVYLSEYNDLSRAFDSEENPGSATRYGLTAGQLHSTSINGLVSAGKIKAHKIVNSSITFSNSIDAIITGKSVDDDPYTIDGLTVVTGLLKQFKPGADVSGLDLTVAGLIKSIQLKGNLVGDSQIRAVGINGSIGSVTVTGELEGSLFATNGIKTIKVGGNWVGDITANGTTIVKGNTVNSITVGGNFVGSMSIGGNVGTINVAGSLGQVGDTLYIDGSLKKLVVGNQKKTNVADVIAIGRTSITDLLIPEGTFDWSNTGVSQINLQALASRPDRRTFAFNVVTVDIEGVATQLVQLVELSTATGAAVVRFHLQDEVALPSGIDAIRAAAFDPTDSNQLYFVADIGGIDRLFRVNVLTGAVVDIAGTFGEVTDQRTIHSIVFDEDAGHVDGRRLLALSREGNRTFVLEVDLNDTDNIVSSKEILVNGKPVTNLTGMELLVDDPATANNTFVLIEASGKNSRVLHLNALTGVAHEIGRTTVTDSLRGQNLQGLTYNPLLVDPFTGQLGAFIAVDATTDELVYVNASTTRVADIVVNGNVDSITVFGQMDGALTVAGNLKQLVVTAENANVGGTLIHDNILVGGDLNTLTVRNGNIGPNATVQSITGNINKVTVTNGSIFGNMIASEGDINSIVVTGSDLHGTIEARRAKLIRFDGSVFDTSVINISELTTLQVGEVVNGAVINVGSLQTLNVAGYMGGDLNLGYRQQGTQIRVGGDWFIADNTIINSDVTITVGGDMIKQNLASVLHVGGSINQLRVAGEASVDMVVDGGANQVFFGSLGGSVITFGHHVNQFTVQGEMFNSLVQVGISAGDDNIFASAAGEEDANETSRIAHLQQLVVGTMTDSIIAAGGTITRVATGTMENSSIAAGLSVGSHAIRAVQNDVTRLANVAEQNAARSGDDRVLFWGDIGQVTVGGDGMISSYISAGVDAGATGDFATPDVLSSVTGGSSRIGRINAVVGAGSQVLADAGIGQNNATEVAGGTVTEDVSYDISDLTTAMGNPLQADAGSATQGSPLLLDGGAVRIVVTGPGTVTVYDDDPSDGVLDAIVLTDTTDKTRVVVEGGGNYNIGRILTADDATVGEFVFDGDLVGDGTDAVDLWIDGSMRRFQFRDLGGDFTGQIGGNIGQMTLANQGSGRVTIGGTVGTLTIGSANDTPLQNMLAAYSSSYNAISIDAAGNVWGHAGNGVLHRLDPTLADNILETINVVDAYSGQPTTLLGIDFLGGNLYGIARLYDPQPTQLIGTINPGGGVDLRGLAVNLAGEVYAIDSSTGVDQLVRIDTATGQQTVVGTLRSTIGGFNYTNHVLALSFRKVGNDSEQLIALVSDRDGNGAGAAGVALVQIDITPTEGFVLVHQVGNGALMGTLLDDGGVINDDFTGLTTDSAGNIYAIRRNGANDELVRIALDGTVTSIGNVEVNGGGAGVTTISGIGFDQDGNLVAYDNDGISGRLIYLSAEDLALEDASAFQELTEGSAPINPDIDVFAMGRSGDVFRTYAYDTAGDGTFYAGAASDDGQVLVLGTVDLVTGAFQRLLTISDAIGIPASIETGANVPLAADQANNALFMVTGTDDGGWELVRFDVGTGTFGVIGRLVDSAGRDVQVSAIDFDEVTGELVGLDLTSRRLVTIDPATGAVAVRTEPAVISAKLTDLAYDVISESFYSFQNTDVNRFVQLKGTNEVEAGRIQAVSVDQVNIDGPYYGRLVTTGNTFNRVTLDGDFYGALVTAGGIRQFTQRSGDFHGLLEAAMDIGTVQLAGDVLDQARIVAGSVISSFNQTRGFFAGSLEALQAGNIALDEVLDGATIDVTDAVSQLTVNNGFAGEATLGSVTGTVRIGLLDDTGRIDVIGDARTLQFTNGTAEGGVVNVGGNVSALNVQGVHEGTVIVGRDLNNATFRDVDGGALIVGRDGNSLNVNNATDGLFAYGVQVGEDGVYNTSDDLIRGGSLKNAKFNTYRDSVLTAGVLPAESVGPGAPADNRVYLRRVAGNNAVTNSVEAGGLRPSTIGTVNITSAITTAASRQSVVVAADGITRITVRNGAAAIQAQTHDDPFGAPTVVEVTQMAPNRIRIVLSEAVSTDSLRLSQVLGDNGTVIVTENGQIVSGVTMVYTEQVAADGTIQGVITLTRNGDFGEEITIRLVGTGDSPIVDRSGLRSELRLVGDPLGTILDGDGDGEEGGDYIITVLAADTGNDFIEDYITLPLVVGETMTVMGTFEAAGDVDIIAFNGVAGQYFAVQYTGDPHAMMAVFFRDDQGTADPLDDTFEVLARYEDTFDDPWLFQAFELPETGEYFVAVTTAADLDGSYTLKLALADDDVTLANAMGGVLTADNRIYLGGNNFQDIAYFSANKRVKKQLVYLNFGGGISTQTFEGTVIFDAFDAAVLDPMLEGQTERLIYGGDGVVGILDKVLTIFTSYPAASVFVDLIDISNPNDLADYFNASSGLFFTVVDPVSSGLYPGQDYTTIFIGEAINIIPDYLGLASNIDLAGLELGDEAIVPTQAFTGFSQVSTVTEMLNQYSNMLANTIAHELLHTMGFNHQPTEGDFLLLPDDPNNDNDPSDSNAGQPGIMAYFPISVDATTLGQLGTLALTPNEFPVGHIDTAWLFNLWFS